jgi:hypothetical protein
MNYSLGLLIVLLLIFWVMCKCIGNNSREPNCKKENMVNDEIYGGYRIRINDEAYPRMYVDNNYVQVPNSKMALERLRSTDIYKCGLN